MQNIQNKTIAEQAALERILNVYFRENNLYHEAADNAQWRITLNESESLTGTFLYWSKMGHHVYHSDIQISDGTQSVPVSCQEAIERILSKLAQSESDSNVSRILEDIQNSITRTAHYLNYKDETRHIDGYIQSEQSLYLGHPFHPTPKSSKGFTDNDLNHYAPECHTQFQLHYLSVDKTQSVTRYVEGLADTVDDYLYALANIEKGALPEHHILLPLHPYQMRGLKADPNFDDMLQKGYIKDLGIRGRSVYPTSSVRTVFEKDLNVYLKLPIHVKITNFIRTNDHEQIERTLDAAEVIAHVKEDVETETFKLMFEQGYRAVQPKETRDGLHLLTETAMIVREGIAGYGADKDIHVLASLFETMPNETTSTLSRMLERSDLNAKTWLQRYLDITIKPMLSLFATTGISLEAHVQNTLVQFEAGVPKVCYVRDLEGISISETIATEGQLIPHVVASDSPVVCTHDTAWHRFKYYVIVNHLGHLVATLGKATGDEAALWQVVQHEMQTWQKEKVMSAYVEDLLHAETFSAKANFISKIKDCGENPIYTNIPNPMCVKEGAL